MELKIQNRSLMAGIEIDAHSTIAAWVRHAPASGHRFDAPFGEKTKIAANRKPDALMCRVPENTDIPLA